MTDGYPCHVPESPQARHEVEAHRAKNLGADRYAFPCLVVSKTNISKNRCEMNHFSARPHNLLQSQNISVCQTATPQNQSAGPGGDQYGTMGPEKWATHPHHGKALRLRHPTTEDLRLLDHSARERPIPSQEIAKDLK